MDTKSLAKSKRAHSLHHKKHHPNQKVKSAVKEKTRVDSTTLASNWGGYEDEYDSMTQDQTYGQTSQPSDILVPKSKGADYAYLLSEAKSQSLSSEIFPILDDFISDFDQGKESFFAVRGESLLSSVQNDSFFVEDKTPANYEASFLSLNMHALANQLAKIDLPKRLFMEADLFPREQSAKVERGSYDHHEVSSSSTQNSNSKVFANSSAKLEAEAAETELDILLDSLADVNLTKMTSSAKKSTLDFDIDSTLDDLLKETSIFDQDNASQIQNVSKSEPIDDFDSWLDTI